jgi:formyl-CoA transferase/CoA:oxalate CoA-transferase
MNPPLAGIKVLDLTRVLAGPYATMSLADLGADVVKVERPGSGDDTRRFGPPFTQGVSTYFLSVNRGKRSIALDLKSPDGKRTVRALARVADVVIENFRPGVMERLGLGAESLRAENPGLIYCCISALGRDKPAAGYDIMVQGLSGIPTLTGDGSVPWKCGASIADLVAGMNAVQGILAALVRRSRTGQGAVVDVSMLDGQLALLTYHASAWLNAGVLPKAWGNQHASIHPYGAYPTASGWLILAIGNDALFRKLCECFGQDWHLDSRFARNQDRVANREALDALLAPVTKTRTLDQWLPFLESAGIPSGPMNTVPEALGHASYLEHAHPGGQGKVRTCVPGVHLDDAPRGASGAPPRVGEHAKEILADWID